MKKLLIVVDYQNDFVSGSLGFEGAEKLEEPIGEKIKAYHNRGSNGQVIFTMDTHDRHYMDTQEGKHLPIEHCIEGQDGWQLYGSIADLKDSNDSFARNKYTQTVGYLSFLLPCGYPRLPSVTKSCLVISLYQHNKNIVKKNSSSPLVISLGESRRSYSKSCIVSSA